MMNCKTQCIAWLPHSGYKAEDGASRSDVRSSDFCRSSAQNCKRRAAD